MRTILVPLDGSELAEQILPYARMLATMLSARIQLFHTCSDLQRKQFFVQHPEQVWSPGEDPLPQDEQEPDERLYVPMQEDAEKYLNTVAQTLREAGLVVEVQVSFGSPPECIVEQAEHAQVNMIAMATHGFSGIRRWTLGSVTNKVVRATTIPVFVVRGNVVPGLSVPPVMQRILVPLDGSVVSKKALPIVVDMATAAQASIHLVHALTPVGELFAVQGNPPAEVYSDEAIQIRATAEQNLETVADEIRAYGISVTTHVAIGYAAEVIIEEAQQQESNVIMMATHGYGGVKRWALGSVADKVLQATITPLVLVHTSASAET